MGEIEHILHPLQVVLYWVDQGEWGEGWNLVNGWLCACYSQAQGEDPENSQCLSFSNWGLNGSKWENICVNSSFPSIWWWEVKWSHSVVSDSAVLWTLDSQAPLSMGFSRQECWSGLPFPSAGDLPSPGIKPGSPTPQTLYRLSHQGSCIRLCSAWYF